MPDKMSIYTELTKNPGSKVEQQTVYPQRDLSLAALSLPTPSKSCGGLYTATGILLLLATARLHIETDNPTGINAS